MLPPLDDTDRADLAALADGTLPAERRAGVEARLAASPALREHLAAQRAALAAVRAADPDAAPERLRAWLAARQALGAGGAGHGRRWRRWAPGGGRAQDESTTVARGEPGRGGEPGGKPRAPTGGRPWWRRRVAGLAGAAAVVAALAVALVLSGAETERGPVAETAVAAVRPPETSAPRPTAGGRLDVASDGLTFPDWGRWRATGVRDDTIAGRRVVTVRYERGGRWVAYAIAARPALDLPSGGGAYRSDASGGGYRSFTSAGRPAVAWHADGRTCVLVGNVPAPTLRRLAHYG